MLYGGVKNITKPRSTGDDESKEEIEPKILSLREMQAAVQRTDFANLGMSTHG